MDMKIPSNLKKKDKMMRKLKEKFGEVVEDEDDDKKI